MAGSSWPVLSAGNVAKASDVNAHFAWLEGSIVPFSNGSSTDLGYDLGTTTARWNFGYIDRLMCNSINATSTSKAVVIGTTTAVTSAANNSDVALEISGNRSLLLPRLSTTQRNNLTGINGMEVYDSTLNQFYAYENGSWKAMLGNPIGFVFPVFASSSSHVTTTVVSVSAPGRLIKLNGTGNTGGYVGELNLDSILFGDYTAVAGATPNWLVLADTSTANTAGVFLMTTTVNSVANGGLYFKNTLIVYHNDTGGKAQTAVWYERT